MHSSSSEAVWLIFRLGFVLISRLCAAVLLVGSSRIDTVVSRTRSRQIEGNPGSPGGVSSLSSVITVGDETVEDVTAEDVTVEVTETPRASGEFSFCSSLAVVYSPP